MQDRVHTFYLYDGTRTAALSFPELGNYLKKTLGTERIFIKKDFLNEYLESLPKPERDKKVDWLAKKLASLKLRTLDRKREKFTPLPGEILYEEKRLEDPKTKTFGILYDGIPLLELFSQLVIPEKLNEDNSHIIFTNQLFATWSRRDSRYHARVIICGFPSVISTSGLVEAPAKPRDYYFLKQQYALLGKKELVFTELKEQFKGKFIDYDDNRITEVMKGYLLQAILFQLRSELFCENRHCRLYNAHWQEEVLTAQLQEPEFCSYHNELLRSMKQ